MRKSLLYFKYFAKMNEIQGTFLSFDSLPSIKDEFEVSKLHIFEPEEED